MELSPSLCTAFSQQVTVELEAATVYLQLAIELQRLGLKGMAAWMRKQSDEERTHADKFIAYMVDRNSHPLIGDIAVPELEVETAIDAFHAAKAHELYVSEAIRELYRKADVEGDLDCRPLLNWFLDEQLEEEASVTAIIDRLDLAGNDSSDLLRIDAELAQRQPA